MYEGYISSCFRVYMKHNLVEVTKYSLDGGSRSRRSAGPLCLAGPCSIAIRCLKEVTCQAQVQAQEVETREISCKPHVCPASVCCTQK